MQEQSLLTLAYKISAVTRDKIGMIEKIMRQTEILALNARIEAARAGTSGAAFSVVAQEMGRVSGDISTIARDFRHQVEGHTQHLQTAGTTMVNDFRGQRMQDLALNAVEIIDRNLFERSCDVRWWATDGALVDAVTTKGEQQCAHASKRLATILRSYTVYLDLWVVDAQGRVIANGRPERYPQAAGLQVADTDWFKQAMQTANGDAFVVNDINRNAVLDEAAVATYATAIREGGELHGKPVGVLVIFFDWEPQAQNIVDAVGLSDEEREHSRVMLLDAGHRIIADTHGKMLMATYPLKLGDEPRGYYFEAAREQTSQSQKLIAFAQTPGYETYQGLGWLGVIEHTMSRPSDTLTS